MIIASHITSQGESTWFEGLMLLAVYSVLVVAFLFA
jgi:Ca2+:H+ antiporter